jgi:peptidoglycan/LPS O-acetylase OafA/YrhL
MFGYVVTICAGGRIFMPGRQFVETPDVFSLVANVLFLQGWVVQRILINGPLWSISIEVFYYLLTPLFVRCRTKSIAAMICISAITFGVLPKEEYWRPLFGGGMLLLAWAWLAGFLLYRNRTDLVRVLIIGLSGLLASIILGGYATNTITISALLVSYAGGITVPRRLQNLLNYLGELSYPLYIIHWPTILGIYAICHISDSSVWIVGSLVMAILVYHAVDQPIRRRRKKQTRKELSASPAVVIQPASSG